MTDTPTTQAAAVTQADETTLGHIQCHCSGDDGVPDVGVSLGLGDGACLWIGELLTRDGGDIGIVFHGPGGQRIAAALWPDCEWQDAADIFRDHVAPILSRLSAAPAGVEEDRRTQDYIGGMLEAASICGDLAENTYDDTDGFAAATGCERSIHKAARKLKVAAALATPQSPADKGVG